MIRSILSFALLLMTSCAPFIATAPSGFASFDKGQGFRAASSDGILYRVRSADNDPKAQIDFWREALRKRMDDAGYTVLSDATIEAGSKEGYLLKLAAPVGTVDYFFWVAVFVHGDDLVIAETTGPANLLNKHDKALAKAIASLQFK